MGEALNGEANERYRDDENGEQEPQVTGDAGSARVERVGWEGNCTHSCIKHWVKSSTLQIGHEHDPRRILSYPELFPRLSVAFRWPGRVSLFGVPGAGR